MVSLIGYRNTAVAFVERERYASNDDAKAMADMLVSAGFIDDYMIFV